jgi:hypothetical protein
MARKSVRFTANLLILILTAVSWFMMIANIQNGALSSSGLASLRYFTVLSNLLEGITAGIFCVLILTGRQPRWAEILKLMAASAVALTFLTVMLFLGPLYGYPAMFKGANLFFHLVIPILAMAEYCILFLPRKLDKKDKFLGAVPTLLYGCFYLINIAVNGVGKWPRTNDWYGFLNWGFAVGMIIFLLLILISVFSALLLQFLCRKTHSAHSL